jgi:hypothetical protein
MTDKATPQAGQTYAVRRADGWHLSRWDGDAFVVTGDQSGDRWLIEWVDLWVHLPTADAD